MARSRPWSQEIRDKSLESFDSLADRFADHGRADRCRVLHLLVEKRLERLARLGDGDNAVVGDPPGEHNLMVVDVLANVASPRNHDRARAGGNRHHDRGWATVTDDGAGIPERRLEGVVREVVGRRHVSGRGRRASLHEAPDPV